MSTTSIRFIRKVGMTLLLSATFAASADYQVAALSPKWTNPTPSFAIPDKVVIAPEQMIVDSTTEIINIIREDSGIQSGDHSRVYALMDAKIKSHLDFDKMSSLMLGDNWTHATAEQKERFTQEFFSTVARFYAVGLTAVQNQAIEVELQTNKTANLAATPLASDRAIVKMRILHGKMSLGDVTFYLNLTANKEWKIYDMGVESIRVTKLFKGQFFDLANKIGIDGVSQKLAEKNSMPDRISDTYVKQLITFNKDSMVKDDNAGVRIIVRNDSTEDTLTSESTNTSISTSKVASFNPTSFNPSLSARAEGVGIAKPVSQTAIAPKREVDSGAFKNGIELHLTAED